MAVVAHHTLAQVYLTTADRVKASAAARKEASIQTAASPVATAMVAGKAAAQPDRVAVAPDGVKVASLVRARRSWLVKVWRVVLLAVKRQLLAGSKVSHILCRCDCGDRQRGDYFIHLQNCLFFLCTPGGFGGGGGGWLQGAGGGGYSGGGGGHHRLGLGAAVDKLLDIMAPPARSHTLFSLNSFSTLGKKTHSQNSWCSLHGGGGGGGSVGAFGDVATTLFESPTQAPNARARSLFISCHHVVF